MRRIVSSSLREPISYFSMAKRIQIYELYYLSLYYLKFELHRKFDGYEILHTLGLVGYQNVHLTVLIFN